MKLSEAIRLGSMLKPQGFGKSRHITTACALDAACLAVGLGDSADTCYFELCHLFPILDDVIGAEQRFTFSDGPKYHDITFGAAIMRLNDGARFSREIIAAFVERYEDALKETAKNGGREDSLLLQTQCVV